MKKFLISAVFVLGFAGYAAYAYFSNSTSAQAVTTASVPASSSSVTFPVSTTTSASGSAPPTNSTSNTSAGSNSSPNTTGSTHVATGEYKNGTYTGTAENAYYGTIQVEAIVSGGKLSNVVFLQYPNDRSTSISINKDAMPQLIAEAIQSQSATVDGVSGASDSSTAFSESLASALAQAQA